MQFEIASRKGRTLLGISVQFVDHLTLKQEVITIGMMHLESTSGLVLKQKMEECRAEYGFFDNPGLQLHHRQRQERPESHP